jgi:GxxExxY protein
VAPGEGLRHLFEPEAHAVHRGTPEAGLLVASKVIIELKSVAALSPVHAKQLLTQLRLSGLKLGLLINFGEAHLKNGIKRVINGQLESDSPSEISL